MDQGGKDRCDGLTLTAREAALEPTPCGLLYWRPNALKPLNLNMRRKLSDAGLSAVASALPNLQILELTGIADLEVGPPGLYMLCKACRKIRRLDLEGNGCV